MKFSCKNIICFLSFAIFIFPPYLLSLGEMRTLYTLLASILSLFYIFIFLFRIKRNRFTNSSIWLYVLICLFYFVILVSTILHNGPLILILGQSIIAVGFMASLFYNFAYNSVIHTLSMLELWLGICCTVNLITILFFPEGLYTIYGYNYTYSNPGYFLGHRNNAIEFLIPLLAVTSYVDLLRGKLNSKRYMIYFLISVITSIMTWSVNAILCVFVIMLCNIYLLKRNKGKIFNIRTLWIASVVGTIAMTGAGAISYLMPYIQKFFDKSQTVLSRIRIWNQSIFHISRSPIIGYGVEEQAIKYFKIGHINSCHNYYLDYLYYGGIVLLIIVVLILETVVKSVNKYTSKIKNKICIYFFAYFILWLGSPIHRDFLFLMFGVFLLSVLIPWEQYYGSSYSRIFSCKIHR